MRFTPILFFCGDCYWFKIFEIPRLKWEGVQNTPVDDLKKIEIMLKMIKIWFISIGCVA